VWTIYYGNGSTFSDGDGSPFEAPRRDVQVIVQSDPRVGWRWISGRDYFVWEPERGGWRETDDWRDHALDARQPLILFGRWLTDAEWAALFARVKAELPPKEGWLVTEARRDGDT
jgi:hypothetical protein